MQNPRRVLSVVFVLVVATLISHSCFAAAKPELKEHPEVGQRFIATDVDWSNVVYQTTFDDPAELKNWKLEGGKPATIRRNDANEGSKSPSPR